MRALEFIAGHVNYNLAYIKKFQLGTILDGPNLNLLLNKKLDKLENFVDPKFHNFIECMRLFHDVQDACFGMELGDDWEAKIHIWMDSYKELGISITPKVHCLMYEVPIFIWETGLALGQVSAQVFETGHFDFEETLKRFKKKETSPGHADSLVDAMSCYAGEHV